MAQAGRRATHVRIERATETNSPKTNAIVRTWSTVCEAWLSVIPMRGTEDYVDGARQAQRVIRLEGDFYDLEGVLEKDRIIATDTDVVWDIKAVLPLYDGRQVTRLEVTSGPGAR